MKKKIFIAYVVCLTVACAAYAFAQSGQESSQTPPAVASGDKDTGGKEPYPGYSVAQQRFAKQEQMVKANAPQVITLANGTRIQRTPADPIAYNVGFLKADKRGCRSCHADLAQLLRDMPYVHLDMGKNYGIDMTVTHCMGCHTYSPGYVTEYYGFGRLIHAIHPQGSCTACHDYSENDGKFHLWDQVKYDILRGITDVPHVRGTFKFTQDKLTKTEDLFSLNWLIEENDYMRFASFLSGQEQPRKMFDDWTIAITGEVNKPFKMKLTDLIKEAPIETAVLKMHCTIDPPTSAMIENVQVKGIPLSYVLKKAGGVKPGATAIFPTSSDGYTFPTTFEHLKSHKAYLVYEINGEPLKTVDGYPLKMFVGGMGAPTNTKQLSEIRVSKEPVKDMYIYKGWVKEKKGFFNKPNIAIFYTKDGQIIKAKQPFTFEGYADAYDQAIKSIEFSLDRGKTWTKYATPGTTADKWVYWYYTFTPKDPGSYVIKARATSVDGLVSETPVTLLVNAE